MRKQNKKRIRLAIRIKLFKNSKRVLDITKYIKSRILRLAQVYSFDKAYLRVNYKDDFYNEGIYYNLNDLQIALKQFTEKKLIDSIIE